MIHLRSILLIALLSTTLSSTWGGQGQIRYLALDENLIHSIPIAKDKGVTTFLLPSAIEGFRANKVLLLEGAIPEEVKNYDAGFILAHVKGSYYFSVRALSDRAEDYLTVIYNRKAYILRLFASDKPALSVTLKNSVSAGLSRAVSPAVILGLLDKAKLYDQFEKHNPEVIVDAPRVKPARIMDYGDYRVLIDEIIRFDAEDTLVFKLILENSTQMPIEFDKQNIVVRLDDLLLPTSVQDLSGVMPPKSSTIGYIAITGKPGGGRNELSPAAKFTVLVPRSIPLGEVVKK